MKRLNVKLLLILAIAFVVLTTGVVVVHAIQMNRSIDTIAKRATSLMKDDPQTALALLKRYRSINPNDPERNADLATLMVDVARSTMQSSDYQAARIVIQQAMSGLESRPDLQSTLTEIQHKLIELNLTFQQYAPARDDLLRLKAKGKNDPKTDLQLAECYIRTTNYAEAIKILESLIGYSTETKSFEAAKATAPKELEAYGTLAALLRQRVKDGEIPDRLELADRVIEQAVEVNSESAKAFLLQAQYASESTNEEKAKLIVKHAVEQALRLAPDDKDVLIFATQAEIRENEFSSAEAHVAMGISKHPKEWRFYYLSVNLADKQKNTAEGTKRMEAGLQVLPTNIFLLDTCFNRQLQEKDFEGARLTLRKMVAAKLTAEHRDMREARVLVAEGNFQQASQKLEQLRPRLVKIPQMSRQADSLLVQCYSALAQPDRLYDAASRIKDTGEGQIGMAYALQALGRSKEAAELFAGIANVLQQAKQLENVPQLPTSVFQLLVTQQMEKPKSDRDWTEVDALLTRIREQKLVKEPTASLMQISLLVCKGETEQAHQLVQELLKQYPKDISVIARGISMALQAQNAEEALQIVNAAPTELRYSPVLLSGRIEAHFAAKEAPEEIKPMLIEIERDAEKLSKEDRARIYSTLGLAYLRASDTQAANRLWSMVADLQPRDPSIRTMQFNLSRMIGDLAKMKEIQEWFEKESNADPAQINLIQASVLVSTVSQSLGEKRSGNAQLPGLDDTDRKNLAKAKALLREVAKLRSGWVEQPKLMADVDILEGRHDDAIAHLREALKLGQPTNEVVKQLVKLLHFRHQDLLAEEVLDTHASLLVGDPEMDRLKAEIYLATGKPQLAEELMRNKFKSESRDASEHLLHGQLLAGAEKWDEAEAEFRKTIELAPDAPDTQSAWLQLIGLLVNNKKLDEARKVVQRAQIELPEDRRALVIAHGYEMLRDYDQADQNYQAALASAPHDLKILQPVAAYYIRTFRPDQARKYLTDILNATPTQPGEKDYYGWARRTMAELMAAEGSYKQFLAAMELLSPTGEKPTPDDIVTRISLLFQRSDPGSSKQALRLLQDLKQVRPLTWRERLKLAQLNERIDNWPAAREEMLSLISQPKADPIVFVTFIEMQLRRGNAEDASNWMRQLQSTGIQITPQVAFLAARVASLQGHGPQAAALLLKLLSAQRPLPTEQWPVLQLLVGNAEFQGYLENIGQPDAAEKLLRENLGNDSEKIALQAALLARRGKITQALDLIEQNRNAFPITSMLHIGMVALRQTVATPKPEEIARVEQWFDRALREEPDSWVVQLELSDLRDFQRRFDESEKAYRAILARQDVPYTTRAIVLNNLSFLLAMQGRNREEALSLINEAINLYGPQSDMLDTRGVVYLSNGETQRALNDFNDAVIVTDPRPIKFVHLAMAQTKDRDFSGARKSMEKAKELKFSTDDLSALEKAPFNAMLKQLGLSS